MTEAGQIFALLRSSSAAELAKRFNALAEGGLTPPASTPAAGPAGSPGAADPARAPGGAFGAGPATPATGGTAPGATAAPGVTQAQQAGPLAAAALATALDSARGGMMRAAGSLAHLAPPRLDIARLLPSLPMADLARMAATVGTGTATPLPDKGTPATEGSLPGVRSDAAVPSRSALPMSGLGSGSPLDPALAQPDGSPPALSSDGGTAPGSAARNSLGGDAALALSSAPATLTSDAPPGRASDGPAAPHSADATPDLASATLAPRSAGATPAAPGVANAAFAQAMVALLDGAATSQTTLAASGVIFNAAMIPGWPFPSALVRDGGSMINARAMLHQLAAQVERMSPQEAAEYLARIGANHAFLRNLRKLLKELEGVDKDQVKGLLFALLGALGSIASGLQTAFRQLSESAALQAAVVHGEDPDDGDRPGRRRLRL